MIVKANTLTRLWEGSVERMLFAKRGEIETSSSMTIERVNLLTCAHMDYEMNVWDDCHLTKARFPKLQRDYLSLPDYEAFLDKAANAARRRSSVASMNAKPHLAHGKNEFMKRGNLAHGGCLMGITFNMAKGKPHLSLHSRATYIAYLGALDLALMYVIGKELGEHIGFEVEECGLTFYVDALQIASMQSAAFFWNRPELMAPIHSPKKYPDGEFPTIRMMRKLFRDWQRKMDEGMDPQDEPYGQLRRYRARWESRVRDDGKWPSIPVNTLTLDALRNPTRRIVDEED